MINGVKEDMPPLEPKSNTKNTVIIYFIFKFNQLSSLPIKSIKCLWLVDEGEKSWLWGSSSTNQSKLINSPSSFRRRKEKRVMGACFGVAAAGPLSLNKHISFHLIDSTPSIKLKKKLSLLVRSSCFASLFVRSLTSQYAKGLPALHSFFFFFFLPIRKRRKKRKRKEWLSGGSPQSRNSPTAHFSRLVDLLDWRLILL